jgi:hypothetical protein
MRFAGVIGGLLGKSCICPLKYSALTITGFVFGYFFNEWIFAKDRRSHWRSEYRLHGVWFPIGSMACGLVLYGLTLQFEKSWVGLAFGWIMINIGMVASTVYVSFPLVPFSLFVNSHFSRSSKHM